MTVFEPKINFSKLDFPTDKLTIRDLRGKIPYSFDVDPPENFARHLRRDGHYDRMDLDNAIGNLIDCERLLAELAFRSELGLPELDKSKFSTRAELFDVMPGDYVDLGVAQGDHEAKLLLKSIESQAKEQAREHSGRRL